LYLLGRARQSRRTAEDNLKSVEYFRRAVAMDPQYVPALVGLSESLLNGLSLNRAPIEDVKAEVEPLLNRAMKINPNLPEVLAAKGWLLNEEYRSDEALPLLLRATKMNPNDASSHRFLGDLYDRRAQPGEAIIHFSAAARLDPMDFISHVFRCMELVDLGEYTEATAACTRARELDPTNMWGPLTTAWISRAQGKTDEALQWIDAARKLEPQNLYLADQKIELLLAQEKFAEARAVMHELKPDESFFSLARESNIVYAEGGGEAVKQWMAQHQIISRAGTGAELIELARMQLISGDPVTARATLVHAERVLPRSSADMFDGGQIRHEYSVALLLAGIELKGGGDKARAMKLLKDLDLMLDRYEENGGEHYGMYRLRAESLAMQGKTAEAQAALNTAWQKGWRTIWRARREPYFAGIEMPK
jgi:tetratricopeptide (TPR) repeat protein